MSTYKDYLMQHYNGERKCLCVYTCENGKTVEKKSEHISLKRKKNALKIMQWPYLHNNEYYVHMHMYMYEELM